MNNNLNERLKALYINILWELRVHKILEFISNQLSKSNERAKKKSKIKK